MIDNLNNYQASVIIDDAQARIVVHMKTIADLEPQVKEYHDAYMKLKNELDSTKIKMEDDTAILEWASAIKNGGKAMRVIRSESHNDMKEREKRKLAKRPRERRYLWTPWAAEILRQIDRMVSADDLYEMVVQEHSIESDNRGKMRWGAINSCILANCQRTKDGNLKGVLFEYKDMVGLREWMTDDYKPKGKYASIFQSKVG